MNAYKKELVFARSVARAAGDIMEKYYRIDQQITVKDDKTPVTVADTLINDMLIEQVQAEFPEDGVIGEEASWETSRERLWVCDPIDGTVAFIMRVPTSMFSLALVIDGKPVIAVAYNPWTQDEYTAEIGKGAYRNGEKITVSQKTWGSGIHITGPGSVHDTLLGPYKKELEEQGVYVNEFPGGVYKGCLIAEGAIEARIFTHSGVHDIAALKLIIEEAGGKVTSLDGREQRYDQPINGALLSNGLVHSELLQLVNR